MIFDKEKFPKVRSNSIPHKEHTIMIVDDEESYRSATVSLFSGDYQIITADNGYEALDLIKSMDHPQEIDLIISDQQMPGLTGVELFEQLLPIIPETIRFIITGYTELPFMMDFINRAKIYEIVPKPFEPEDLKLRVKRALEAQSYKKELEEIRISDRLTGLRNKRYLYESIGHNIAKSDRDYESWLRGRTETIPSGSDMTFILLDIDRFKKVNDMYGHTAGDNVLIQVAGLLKKYSRAADMQVRWSGEEFLIVARFTPRHNIIHLVERLHKAIENHPFEIEPGNILKLTCSIGYAAYPFLPRHYKEFNMDGVIKIANKALNAAKNSGGGAWVGFFATLDTNPENLSTRIDENLEELIANGELETQTSFDIMR